MRTALVLGLMVVSAILAGRTMDTMATSAVVETIGESFSPETVVIDVGDTVTWVNNGLGGHNARAGDGTFRSPNLSDGATFSHTFTTPGTYDYLCSIHPSNMTGRVIVRGAAATSTAVPTVAPTMAPATQAPSTQPPATSTPVPVPTVAPTNSPAATATTGQPSPTVGAQPSAATATPVTSPTPAQASPVTSTAPAQPTTTVSSTAPAETGSSEKGWGVPLAIAGFAGLAVAGVLLRRRR